MKMNELTQTLSAAARAAEEQGNCRVEILLTPDGFRVHSEMPFDGGVVEHNQRITFTEVLSARRNALEDLVARVRRETIQRADKERLGLEKRPGARA